MTPFLNAAKTSQEQCCGAALSTTEHSSKGREGQDSATAGIALADFMSAGVRRNQGLPARFEQNLIAQSGAMWNLAGSS